MDGVALRASGSRVQRDRGDARPRAGERVGALVDQHGLGQHLKAVEQHLQGAGRLERLFERRVPVAKTTRLSTISRSTPASTLASYSMSVSTSPTVSAPRA
ncbi:MAG: hypothetical protein ACXW08_16325 [Solirubrobacteraceae bacterium]